MSLCLLSGCTASSTKVSQSLTEEQEYKQVMSDVFNNLVGMSINLKEQSKLSPERVEQFFDKILELAELGIDKISEKKEYPKDMAPIIEEMGLD